MKTLYDSNGIKAIFNHDKVEQPLLDRKIVREGADMIARKLAVLKQSSRERASHHLSEPTWTGKSGVAGATVAVKREVKREPGTFAESDRQPMPTRMPGVRSADILEGLKQLAAIRA